MHVSITEVLSKMSQITPVSSRLVNIKEQQNIQLNNGLTLEYSGECNMLLSKQNT